MEFVASIFENVFRPLKDFFAKSYGYVAASHYYIDELEDEMNELKSKRDDVGRMVDAAERQGLEATSQVKWWLESVDKLEEEVGLIKSEYEARHRLPMDQAASIRITYLLSKKADETMEEVRNLKERTFAKVADELVQVRFEEMPTVPVVGMDPIMEQLKTSLEDSEVGIIGIFGMAGVGKTALLNKFNNEYLVGAEGINVAIYIEVTHDYDLNKIQKIIGDRLGLSWDKKGPKERAVVLYKVLSKMNFVIILDDIWEPINLRMLGIPVPKQQSKSKIFLSTRIEDVCDRMDVRRKVKFDCLPWEHAWELFQEKVGDVLAHPNPEIHRLAETVATKCGGLPLALITVGRALASKRTTKEWKHAITVLKIAPWQLLGMENDLLVPLKHSYDNLPNDKLRLCLLYCSLFPEDFSIFKEWIIGYCIGEGFIDDLYTEMDEIYNKGHDLLGDLKTASLLESEDEEHIKMHPMVRAMALWIASDYGTKETKWLVRAGIGLKEALGAEKWSEAERISFMRNNIFELYEQPKCPSLKTLMLQSNPTLEKICDGFFQYMPTLRVLDLSHTSISELPSGLSALGQLQYLDLYNTNIKVLPSELGELVNLRFLLLSQTPLETIPNGVLCRLTLLQVLYMDLSYGDWKVGISGNGVEFQELESLRRLKAFDATIKTLAALQRLAQSPRLAGSTRNLLIKAAAGLKTLELPSSDLWKNMTKLKRVWAWGCADLEEVVINGPAVQHDNDPNMLSNVIRRGYNTIPDEEQLVLPDLESIILQQLQKAKIIYKGGYLQQLTSLFIWHCPGLEHLITCANDEDEQQLVIIEAFPKLKELYLHGLMQFKSFSTERYLLSFPSLENLKVIECPRLKKFELSAKDLMEIHGANEWWNALEWEDDMEVKERFRPLFRPLR
ncbi:disease resistance protein SUMM2-like [Carex rostrata]